MDTTHHIAHMLQIAETALTDNLMSFWAHNTWDMQYGGFLTRLDRRGRILDATEKVLMMQVRMIAALSAAHRHGLRDFGYLDLARRGYEYLIDAFWDQEQGGFFFSLTRDGVPRSTRKNTDFHAYAMTGLVEYYRASGDEEALAWAGRTFDLLLEQAADRDMGFVEDFDDGTWPPLNAEQMKLDEGRQVKTIDMHANMLEGMMYLAAASGDENHVRALDELLQLICEKGIHPQHGCTITAFDDNWQPVGDAEGRMTTSYGLNVELAWFIWESASIVPGKPERYHQAALGLLDHALAFGFDHERGGLAAFGPLTGHVLDADILGHDRLIKSWWAQAELVNALCEACNRCENTTYFEPLSKTFDWIYQFQMDHDYGDWYQDTDWYTGEPLTTDKGREFKTAFHAGRALIRAITAFRKWL